MDIQKRFKQICKKVRNHQVISVILAIGIILSVVVGVPENLYKIYSTIISVFQETPIEMNKESFTDEQIAFIQDKIVPNPSTEVFRKELSTIEKEMSKVSEMVIAEYAKGATAFKSKRFDAAISHFKKVKEMVRDTPSPYSSLAASYLFSGRVNEAINSYKEAVRASKDVGNLHLQVTNLNNQGVALVVSNNRKGAIAVFTEAIKLKPNSSMSYSNRGMTRLDIKQYKEAIQDFDKAVEIDPSDFIALYDRGIAKNKIRDYSGSIEDYTHAIKINPSYADPYYNRALSKLRLGNYEGAIADYSKVIEIYPNHVIAHYNRGTTYAREGQYDLAILDLAKVIEIDPSYVNAYHNRGHIYGKKGQYDLAISDYTKAIEVYPNHASAYLNRGITYMDKGQYDLAVSDLTKAIEIDPKSGYAYNIRGEIYMEQLDKETKACTDWKKACELGKCDNYNHAKSKNLCK